MNVDFAKEFAGYLSAAGGLAAAWTVVVGQAMNIKTNIIHETCHQHSLKSRKRARRIAEALGIAVLAPPLDVYAAAHLPGHHHPGKVGSMEDADVQFVRNLGFYPGMKVEAAWARYRRALVSPAVHLRLLAERLRDNFARGPLPRRIAAVAWWTGVPALAAMNGVLGLVGLAYILPVTVIYQMAMITQALSEHRHFTHPAGDRSRNWHAAVSHARFLGAPLPDRELPLIRKVPAYALWLARMVGALVIRTAVLPGELIVHAGHHWSPSRANWVRAPYSYRDLKAEMPQDQVREFWGLKDTLNDVFKGFESARD